MNKVFNKLTKEIWVGIGVGIFAIVYLVATLYIKKGAVVSIGADFMPRVYGFLMLLVSMFQVIGGVMHYRAAVAANEPTEATAEEKEKSRKSLLPVLLVFVIMIVCIALMNKLGFVISGAIMTFGMCCLLTPYYEKRHYLIFAVFSVVLAIGAYLLFKNVLYVSLPSGILPF